MRTPSRALAAMLGGFAAAGLGIGAPAFAQEEAASSGPAASEARETPPVASTAPAARRLNTTGEDLLLVVPVREFGPLGLVRMRLAADDRIWLSGEDLRSSLESAVTQEALDELLASQEEDGSLSEARLEELGYEIVFDPALVEVEIAIPLRHRQRREISLGYRITGFDRDAEVAIEEPEGFSLLIDHFTTYEFNHEQDGGGEQANLRSIVNIGGRVSIFAYENSLFFDANSDSTVTREASRLIYDQVEAGRRWSFGDLLPIARDFQSSPDMAGISLEQLFAPGTQSRTVSARTQRTFTLRRSSEIDVLVNGVIVETLRLPPGQYDLLDFPLTTGANDVQLRIEDETGAIETLDFSFFNDPTLLGRGASEYAAAAGILSQREVDGIDYFTDTPVFTGFYRYGLTDTTTVGANVQATSEAWLIGAESVIGTPLGIVDMSGAASSAQSGDTGFALRAAHTIVLPFDDRPGGRVFSTTAEYYSEDFATIQETTPSNPFAAILVSRYSQPITRTVNLSIGVDYSLARGDVSDRYGASARINWQINPLTNFSAGVTYLDGSAEEDNDGVNFSLRLSRTIGQRSSVGATYETENNLTSVAYSRSPEAPLNDWSLVVNASRDDFGSTVNGEAAYWTNRGEASIAHATTYDDLQGDISSQTTTLRAGSALGFAGGRFALGPRMNDSFAIVTGHESLEGRDVLIRGGIDDPEIARTGALGPALVSIPSNARATIPFDVEDLPAGYDLGTGTFEMLSPLHGGYELTVGSAYNVTVIATLLLASGEPLQLAVGEARSLDDEDAPVIQVFTNRTGRFGAPGVGPGRWRITFEAPQRVVYDILVDQEAGQLVRLGELRPGAEQVEEEAR